MKTQCSEDKLESFKVSFCPIGKLCKMNKTINHWFFFIMSVAGGQNNFFQRNLVFVKDSEFRIIIDLHYNLWDWVLINYIL